MIKINLPLNKNKRTSLKAGQKVLLSGRLYTARDMSHKKFFEIISKKRPLPMSLKDEVLYYCGPTPAFGDKAIGSCGPTTSSRMDPFTIPLLKRGLGGMIGKGRRSEEVRRAIKRFKSVYFIATGGIGALLSKKIKRASVIAFRELGTEAIYELEVEDFPVTVAIDTKGRDVYED